MYSTPDLETAIDLWDNVKDDTIVYVSVIPGKMPIDNSIFMEGNKKSNRHTIRVFLHREEADMYRRGGSGRLSLVKTNIEHLIQNLNRIFKNREKSGKDTHCVLSTIDVDGQFYGIELLWSKFTN